MAKYRFLGPSIQAEQFLTEEDIQKLFDMVGCEIELHDEASKVDGKRLFMMPDGELTHVDFLEFEEIQPELPFED
jgi:hypothetical protein